MANNMCSCFIFWERENAFEASEPLLPRDFIAWVYRHSAYYGLISGLQLYF